MNEIKAFESPEFGEIRTTTDNSGKVLFCGKDVAAALGYAETAKAIREHCKGVSEIDTPTGGGVQKMKFITEGDLYRLITHSKLTSAEKFENWVFDEVLPTIRKHGAYMTENTIEQAIINPDFLIKLATQLKAEQEKRRQLETTNKIQEQQIAELQPKASYYDIILNCDRLIAISVIAKDYGKSGTWLNKYLHEKGVQYCTAEGVWLLYRQYAAKGYTSTKSIPFKKYDGTFDFSIHTYWTQKGRLFIYDLLKSDNILPLIERAENN